MNNKGRSLRMIVLLVWTLGILAPVYSVSRLSSQSQSVFDQAFRTQTSHVMMHVLLYAALAALMMSSLVGGRFGTFQLLLLTLIGTSIIAMLQEMIQLRSEGLMFGPDEIFDLLIDLSGGLLGAMLFLLFRRSKGAPVA